MLSSYITSPDHTASKRGLRIQIQADWRPLSYHLLWTAFLTSWAVMGVEHGSLLQAGQEKKPVSLPPTRGWEGLASSGVSSQHTPRSQHQDKGLKDSLERKEEGAPLLGDSTKVRHQRTPKFIYVPWQRSGPNIPKVASTHQGCEGKFFFFFFFSPTMHQALC